MKIPDIQYSRPQEIAARSNQTPSETEFSGQLACTNVETGPAHEKASAGSNATSTGQPQSVFSADEREYFNHLFPAAPGDPNACQTYSPAGACAPGTAGSILDRKG